MSYKTAIYNSPMSNIIVRKPDNVKDIDPSEPIWELQEAAIVGAGNSSKFSSSSPDATMLSKTRDERQDAAYAYYATLKIYTAAQTLDLIDRWDIWPREEEGEWSEFVGRVYSRAEVDDTERRARASQSLAEADNAQGLRNTPETFEDCSCVSYVSGGLS